MSDPIARPRVEFNSKKVESQLKKLAEEADRLGKALTEAVRLKDVKLEKELKKQLRTVNQESRQLKMEVLKVDNVLRDLNGTDFNTLKKAFNKQQKIVRSLRKDAKEYNAELQKLKTLKTAMNGFNSGLREQQGFFKKLTGNFNNYFGVITAGLASLTGVAMSARKAVDMANNREDVKGNVKALTGLANEEIDYLEKQAVEYSTKVEEHGIRIQKSADEILQAFQLVGSAQPALLKNKEALAAVTKEMLILSEAGENGIELKDAIDATTKAMNQYGASASETSRYTNAMAAGAQKGAVPINEVGAAIKEFGKSASKADVPIEKSVALLEVIGERAGIVGPRAGIQMRNFFAVLASGANETNPEIVGLDVALQNLEAQGMSTNEYTKMFGRENALVASTIIENRKYLDEMTEALTNTSTAYDQAAANTKDNKAKLNQARNAAKEYAIELGKKLQPAMTHLVSKGTLIIKMLTRMIGLFEKHGAKIIWLASAIGTYIAVVKAQKLWNDKLVPSFKRIQKAIEGFATSGKNIKEVLKPNIYAAVASGIMLAVSALVKLNREAIKGKVNHAELNKKLREEGKELNNLFEALKLTNPQSEERKRIILKLNAKYPEYVKNHQLEKASLNEIEKAQKAVNDQLYREIAAKQMKEDMDDLQEKAQRKIQKSLDKVMSISGSNGELKALMVKDFEDAKKAIQDGGSDIEKELQKFTKKYNIKKYDEVYNSGERFLSKNYQYSDVENALKDIVKFEGQLKVGQKTLEDYYNKIKEINNVAEEVPPIIPPIPPIPPETNEDIPQAENHKEQVKKEEDLQKALFELRKSYNLVKREELYQEELDKLDNHKARKLLSEEDYLKAKYQLYQKYLGSTVISEKDEQQDVDEFVEEETADPFSIDSKRAMAEQEYQREKYKETLDWKYEQLQGEWERGEIGWTEYYQRLEALDTEHEAVIKKTREQKMEEFATKAQGVADLVTTINRAATNFELKAAKEKYENDLKGAGNNAKKKEKIEAEYQKKKEKIERDAAEKQKMISLAMAAINMALAITKASAVMPPANIPAIAFATAVGIANMAAIASQTFETGGYTGFDGKNDDVAGIVHKNEFVANAKATANPKVKSVLDIIHLAQKDGSIETLDLPAAVEMLNINRGMQKGGYVNNSHSISPSIQTTNEVNSEKIDKSEIILAAQMIKEAANILYNRQFTIGPEAIEKITQVQEDIKVIQRTGAMI